MDIQEKIKNQLKEMREQLGAETKREEIVLSPSDKREHGDYASNIAFRKAKLLHRAPLRLAEKNAAEIARNHHNAVGNFFFTYNVKNGHTRSALGFAVVWKTHYSAVS